MNPKASSTQELMSQQRQQQPWRRLRIGSFLRSRVALVDDLVQSTWNELGIRNKLLELESPLSKEPSYWLSQLQ